MDRQNIDRQGLEPEGNATGVIPPAPPALATQHASESSTSDLERSASRGENTVIHHHYHCCHSHTTVTQGHPPEAVTQGPSHSLAPPLASLPLPPFDTAAIPPPTYEDVTSPQVQRQMREDERLAAIRNRLATIRNRRLEHLERGLTAANDRLEQLERSTRGRNQISPQRVATRNSSPETRPPPYGGRARSQGPRRGRPSPPHHRGNLRQNQSENRPRPVLPGSDNNVWRRHSRPASPNRNLRRWSQPALPNSDNPAPRRRRRSSGEWEPILVISPVRNRTCAATNLTDNHEDDQPPIAPVGPPTNWRFQFQRLPMGNGVSPREFLAQHNLPGFAESSAASSRVPSLESLTPADPPTSQANANANVSRDWLTHGLTRVIVELRKLFLGVFVETRYAAQGQPPVAVWNAVMSAIINTGTFPSEERFDAAWRFAFQQSPYAHIWELLQMDIEEVSAMLAALEGADPQ